MTEEQMQEAQGCFCAGLGPQASEMLRQAMPQNARKHFRQARIELLKGIRSLLDRRIEELSRPEPKGTTVPVE